VKRSEMGYHSLFAFERSKLYFQDEIQTTSRRHIYDIKENSLFASITVVPK